MFIAQPSVGAAQVPSDWTTTNVRKGQVTFTSGDGRESISRFAYDDNPDLNADALLDKVRDVFIGSGCGPASAERRETLYRGAARQISIRNGVALCLAAVGRTADGIDVILCNCAEQGQGAAAFTGLVQQVFGQVAGTPAARSDTVAANPAPATRSATPRGPLGVSAPSSVPRGVWVALVNRTVFDPVMTVRMELGPAYLILTPGGYFMTEMPSGVALDDAGAQNWARGNPDEAGTYRREGNRLVLTFASGERQVATISGSGTDQSITLDQKRYIPKRYFADGTRLQGLYTRTRITQASASVFVVGKRDLAFLPDGRFARGAKVNTSGSGFSISGGRDERSGRYRIEGSALVLAYDDGEIETLPMWQETPDGPIWFDGEMYSLAE